MEKNGFALDNEDRLRVKRLFRYCELCPLCYRPFGVYAPIFILGQFTQNVDRYTRHKIFSEIASFYVFAIVVWFPLLIIFCLPALFSYYFNQTEVMDHTSDVTKKNRIYGSGYDETSDPFENYHKGYWHESIKEAIDSVHLKQKL